MVCVEASFSQIQSHMWYAELYPAELFLQYTCIFIILVSNILVYKEKVILQVQILWFVLTLLSQIIPWTFF